MDGLALVRRAAMLPGLRRLTGVRALTRATAALRGALVRERARFAINELRPRDAVRTYTLRDRGQRVVIRHHTWDVHALDMAFSGREFEPPAEAVAVLNQVELTAVDLGANIGLFGVWLLGRHARAKIVSYEPDPGNAAMVAHNIEANRADDRWTLRRAAAAPADGTLSFAAGQGPTSRVVDAPEDADAVITVDARDPFPDLMQADFVKIDIEGGEWKLLADPRFPSLPARVVCVEYHLLGAPSGDPGAAAERMVRAGGWAVRHEARPGMPGHGMVWGWRDGHPAGAAPSAQPAASARS